jgi:hypothetical protein
MLFIHVDQYYDYDYFTIHNKFVLPKKVNRTLCYVAIHSLFQYLHVCLLERICNDYRPTGDHVSIQPLCMCVCVCVRVCVCVFVRESMRVRACTCVQLIVNMQLLTLSCIIFTGRNR